MVGLCLFTLLFYCQKVVGCTLLDTIRKVAAMTEFKEGDLVWGKMRGFPSWPGKVVIDLSSCLQVLVKVNLQLILSSAFLYFA